MWFARGKFNGFKDKFASLDGKDLATLTKEDFQKELGNIQGSALFNAVQELKKGLVDREFGKFELVMKKLNDNRHNVPGRNHG